jgi:proteasome lid subunit RPN8/RPN11
MPENERQIDADAYHIWTPRPLLRSIYWKPEPEPPREAVSTSYEVYLDQRAFASMHEHVWQSAVEEPFGWLVGDLCEDPAAGRRFVIVTGAVPSRFPFREGEAEGASGEAVVALRLEVERRRGVLVGWYHAHAHGPPRLTESDVAEHESRFGEPWQVAFLFVTDPASPAGACFRRTPEGFDGSMQMPFHEMVSNESLLARGVRRSRIDWVNVATLDQVRSDPPPRPESPPAVAPAAPSPEPADAGGAGREGPAVEAADLEMEAVDLEPMAADLEPEAGARVPEGEPEAREEEPDPFVVSRFDADAEALEPSGEAELAGEAVAPGAGSAEERRDEPRSSPGPAENADEFDAMVAELQRAARSEESIGPAAGASPPAEAEVVRETVSGTQGPQAGEPEGGVPVETVEGSGEATEEEALSLLGEPAGPAFSLVEVPPPEPPSPIVARSEERPSPVGTPSEETGPPRREAEPAPVSPRAPPEPEPVAEGAEASRRLPRRVLHVSRGPVIATLAVVAAVILVVVALRLIPRDAGTPARDRSDAPSSGAETRTPEPAAPTITGEELMAMSDRVLEAISRFYGRDVARERGEIGCPELQVAFVEVMDSWIDYSARGKQAWQGRLPTNLAERDERLYRGVQDVERLFGASGCPRP